MRMRHTKVVLFTDTFCDINGVSRFLQDIAGIAQNNSLGLYIITSSVKSCPEMKNVYIVKPKFRTKIPFYPELDLVLPSYKALKHILDQIEPDVVHISTPGFVGMMGRRIAKKRSLPVIGVYHTDFPAFAYNNLPFKIVKYIADRFMQNFYKDFKALFVRSESYRKIVNTDVKFDNENIHILQAGIDVDKFNRSYKDMEIWEEYNIPKNATKALYVGRLTKEKNFPLLIDLWKQYYQKRNDKNIYLIVLGGDVESSLFEQYHIKSLGVKRGEALSKLYASSDLFLFPSTTDTLGQVVMEAMSSGLPVIVSDKGGPKTLINEERRNGYAIDTSDQHTWLEKISELMENKILRDTLGENGHKYISDMGISKSFDAFWYEHVKHAQNQVNFQQ